MRNWLQASIHAHDNSIEMGSVMMAEGRQRATLGHPLILHRHRQQGLSSGIVTLTSTGSAGYSTADTPPADEHTSANITLIASAKSTLVITIIPL